MKVSPDVFLHDNGLRYDEYGGFGTTDPAAIVKALVALNNTRYIDEFGNLVETVYQTPGFVAGGTSPANTSPYNVQVEGKLQRAYLASLKTGSPAAVHAAVDAWNSIRMAMGAQGPIVPPSDFAILAEGNTLCGKIADMIISLREAVANGDQPGSDTLPAGAVVPWFDQVSSFQKLNDYVKG